MIRPVVAITMIGLGLAGCSASPDKGADSGEGKLVVAASFYPIAEIVSRVGGSQVDVINLTPPGTEAHDVEITAKQMERLDDAAVTFYLGQDFQPGVQDAIAGAGVESVDLLESARTMTAVGTSEIDPHVWLDPANMILMTRTVTTRLATLRPQARDVFEKNSDDYIGELEALGTELDSALADCQSPVLVTAHRSFSYFAARAGLRTNSLLDYSGEDSATSKDLESFADYLRANDVTTVFYEESIAQESMRAVADMVGARTSTLVPIETVTRAEIAAGDDYLSLQRGNIQRVAEGLRCS